MTKRVSNPRLETTKFAAERFKQLAQNGNVPLYDDKNDGGTLDDFLEVVEAAASDPADFATYKLDARGANRGTYPSRR